MMHKLAGYLGIGALLWASAVFGGGCTPTDRNFGSTGGGGAGGEGGGGQGGGCPVGFAECDGNPETTCETDTTTSLDHCGVCDNACTAVADGNIGCVAAKCAITSCNNGRENCDNFYDNGCETNPTTSFDHCGACANSCEAPDAITACVAGACQLAQCVMGKLDCDMDPKTGCEVDPTTNVDHCGACGQPCMAAHAMMTCDMSQCSIAACDTNYLDCDQNLGNGCEVDVLSTRAHCGMCGNDCGPGGCRNGSCIVPVLVGRPSFSPGKLAIFKSDMYIGSRSSQGEIGKVAVAGGTPVVIGMGPGLVYALDVNIDGVYIASAQGTLRMSLDGASKTTYSNNQASRGVAALPNRVYWTALSSVRYTDLVLPLPMTFFSASTSVLGLFADTSKNVLYWTVTDGGIWSSTIPQASPKQLALGPPTANNIVVDDKNAYWSSTKGLHRLPLAGGEFVDMVLASTIRSVAIDATHVYWTEEGPGLVQRMLKDGSGPVEIIGYNQQGPHGLALDSQFVYWSNSDTAEIWKAPK